MLVLVVSVAIHLKMNIGLSPFRDTLRRTTDEDAFTERNDSVVRPPQG